MSQLVLRWRKLFGSGRTKTDEAIELAQELRSQANEVVDRYYSMLDGEEQWLLNNYGQTKEKCHCDPRNR